MTWEYATDNHICSILNVYVPDCFPDDEEFIHDGTLKLYAFQKIFNIPLTNKFADV